MLIVVETVFTIRHRQSSCEFYLLEQKLLKGMVTSLLGLQRLNEKIQLNL